MKGEAKIVTHGGVVHYQVKFDNGETVLASSWAEAEAILETMNANAVWVGDAIQRPTTGPDSRLLP